MATPGEIFGSAKVSRQTFAKRTLPGDHPEHFLFDSYDDWIDSEFENPRGGFVVYGLSKTGKTSFVEEAMARSNYSPVYVQGQDFSTVSEFWNRISDVLSVPTGSEVTSTHTTDLDLRSGINAGVVSVSGGATDSLGKTKKYSRNSRSTHEVRQSLISSGRPLVIDDFHNCGRNLSSEMAKVLKPLVREVLVVLIAIPSESFSPVRETIDNTGRFKQVEFSLWSEDELKSIGSRGFPHLGYGEYADQLGKMAADEAFGSPHIMQDICLKLSIAMRKSDVTEMGSVLFFSNHIENVLRSVAEAGGNNIIDDLVKGKSSKGQERNIFKLSHPPAWVKQNFGFDHYGIGLIALADFCRRKELVIKVSAITEVLRSFGCTPSQDANRAGRTMRYFGEIADERRGNLDPALVYTSETAGSAASEISIVDPFLAFYLSNSNWIIKASKD